MNENSTKRETRVSNDELHEMGNELQALRIGMELLKLQGEAGADLSETVEQISHSVLKLITIHSEMRDRLE